MGIGEKEAGAATVGGCHGLSVMRNIKVAPSRIHIEAARRVGPTRVVP